ncbi:helix-turn-helix domain-containing protein [Clostridium sp.]|uniref:helix-turn-helix domain-containing protein n=1 Tax=Clostridium sp. TaxID=1506 RepID=UPI002901DE04|nr:helix-turn-helix domain-containing protein [Clostridium sp.]MDU2157754.1 helix-turn-helix domain-containing protein [Clostridium sp.]
MENQQLIPYNKILKASQGNTEEINWIINYYKPYITTLATIECTSQDGKVYYVIDDEIYNRIKIKLIKKILNFKPIPYEKVRGI